MYLSCIVTMGPTLRSVLHQKLKEHFLSSSDKISFSTVGGGCINETHRIIFEGRPVFCKINSATRFPSLFEKEKNGLQLLARNNVIKTPKLIGCFETNEQQVLLLEWIEEGERTGSFWKKFGEQLAALHKTPNHYFGLGEDNYIGSVFQVNHPSTNWIDFFVQQRLYPLIDKNLSQKLLTSKHRDQFETLCKQLPSVFDENQKPSLVHGDLWSGNFMCTQKAEPVLIDPAAYFGHPSIDLGMTTLFGGFHSGFYEAYSYHFPFPPNYKEQWEVCNLYPLLVHLYLFGKSYLSQIETTLKKFSLHN